MIAESPCLVENCTELYRTPGVDGLRARSPAFTSFSAAKLLKMMVNVFPLQYVPLIVHQPPKQRIFEIEDWLLQKATSSVDHDVSGIDCTPIVPQ